jgi:hypothetical protein
MVLDRWKTLCRISAFALAILAPCMPAQSDTQLTGPTPKPIKAPSQKAIQESIKKGVQFLVNKQNPDGSWGAPLKTKGLNIYASVPGSHQAFRAAVTAMCVSALIETGTKTDASHNALVKGEKWLLTNLGKVRRADPVAIYNVWTHGYGVQALVRMHKRLPKDKKRQNKIEEQIKVQFDLLKRYESVNGGWGYYDFNIGAKRPSSSSISFCNAAILVALKEADNIGIHPPSDMVNRAIVATQKQRKPDFSYLYGDYLKHKPMAGINRPAGSLGRSQSCNAALGMWGDRKITNNVLNVWLDRLWARNDWLGIGRKRPVPHEAWFQVAGYFYYFGHYYASRCIEMLPAKDQPHHKSHLAFIIMKYQERDGCWWDFPFYDYHQPYGTAFALMTLQRCKVKK